MFGTIRWQCFGKYRYEFKIEMIGRMASSNKSFEEKKILTGKHLTIGNAKTCKTQKYILNESRRRF